jgi:predicted ATPase/class 3 adenylate cyclase
MPAMREIRALLLTDVVDSTKLSERIGDAAMAQVWLAHDRAARDLLLVWHGCEIDKTDGMLMMFDTAAEAVNYAIAYHRALAALPAPLKARAGLHVGPVILRENSAEDVARGAKPLEVDGLAKPTAARVMSLARGGQILLTSEARAALGEATLKLASHGHWVMKGVAEPIELFEIGDEGTHFATPPDSEKVYRVVRVGERWLPVAQMPNNLPQQATSFVGRERELDEVKVLLDSARLVTVVGAGGLGKTRLSVQVAAELMPRFPDGVWFADLSALTEASLLANTVAQAVGASETPQVPADVALLEHLKHSAALLVLDNCEQIAHACAELVGALVGSTSRLRILATSREALHLPFEFLYGLEPLALPAGAGVEAAYADKAVFAAAGATRLGQACAARLRAARDSGAVRLFVERAAQASTGFELTTGNVDAVVDICARLDGLPLAIELAAARVALLGVDGIRDRLEQRFRLLAAPAGSRVTRHQTLRQTIDWSYQLLSPPEQRLFACLGVFAGGFTLEGAQRVAAQGEADEEWELLDRLGALVDKSMVVSDRRSSPRYRMLESVRQFALARLGAGPDEPEVWRRFDDYCEHLVVAAEADLMQGGEAQSAALARLEAERDNLRTILSRDLSADASHTRAAKLCGCMYRYWLLRGHWREGVASCERVIGQPGALQGSFRAKVLLGSGSLIYRLGQFDAAVERLHGALLAAEPLGDPLLNGRIFMNLGNVAADRGESARARDFYESAGKEARAAGSAALEAMALSNAGRLALMDGNREVARPILERALQLSRATGNLLQEAHVLSYLVEIARLDGDFDLSDRLNVMALGIATRLNNPELVSETRAGFAEILVARGKFAEGARKLCEILGSPELVDNPFTVAECLGTLAQAAAGLGSWRQAAQLYAAAQQLDSTMGRQSSTDSGMELQRVNERSLAELGAALHAAARKQGAEASLPEVIANVRAWVAALP